MSIVKRPQKKSVEDFIKGAPDSVPAAAAPAAAVADETIKRVMLGKQAQISLAMPLDLLARIDEQAASRAVEGEGV